MNREKELLKRIKERMWQDKIKEMVEKDEAELEYPDYLSPVRERLSITGMKERKVK